MDDQLEITRQVTLGELFEDPVYRDWFKKKPAPRPTQSWRVYVQREEGGPWLKKDFSSWVKAYNFLVRNYKHWHDAALSSRVWVWRPPVVVDPNNPKKRRYHHPVLKIIDHTWCPHCRRPTVFRKFSRHHNIGQTTRKLRCTICGISMQGIRVYKPREE